MNRRLGGPKSGSERFGEEKNVLSLSVFQSSVSRPFLTLEACLYLVAYIEGGT